MKREKANRAFTLIELLVVIAIIGILAALIANLAGNAADKRKINRVKVELAKLETVIDNYQLERGSYPPDNGDLIRDGATRPSARMNPLYYELAGTVFTNGIYRTLQGGNEISPGAVKSFFNRGGISNSRRGSEGDAKQFYAAKENEIKAIAQQDDKDEQRGVLVLVGPVDLNPGEINPWRYDASSTNRHNADGYDLWLEFVIGGKTNIIGNWNN